MFFHLSQMFEGIVKLDIGAIGICSVAWHNYIFVELSTLPSRFSDDSSRERSRLIEPSFEAIFKGTRVKDYSNFVW